MIGCSVTPCTLGSAICQLPMVSPMWILFRVEVRSQHIGYAGADRASGNGSTACCSAGRFEGPRAVFAIERRSGDSRVTRESQCAERRSNGWRVLGEDEVTGGQGT